MLNYSIFLVDAETIRFETRKGPHSSPFMTLEKLDENARNFFQAWFFEAQLDPPTFSIAMLSVTDGRGQTNRQHAFEDSMEVVDKYGSRFMTSAAL